MKIRSTCRGSGLLGRCSGVEPWPRVIVAIFFGTTAISSACKESSPADDGDPSAFGSVGGAQEESAKDSIANSSDSSTNYFEGRISSTEQKLSLTPSPPRSNSRENDSNSASAEATESGESTGPVESVGAQVGTSESGAEKVDCGMQPTQGAYMECGENPNVCVTTVCYQLTNSRGDVEDGFCTRKCETDENCGTALGCDAIPSCYEAGDKKLCVLDCKGDKSCPMGMKCTPIEGRQGQVLAHCI